MTNVVIIAAKRTAVGSFMGALAPLQAHELGKAAIVAALEAAEVAPTEVDEVIMGNVLTGALGQGPARQAAIAAGIPADATALTINQICGSGLRAVALGAQAIQAGDARIVVAGGQESMSNSPHAQRLRNGSKMGNVQLVDTMLKDGLTDAFDGEHMGLHMDRLATELQVTREDQDRFACQSQNRAEAAREAGRFRDEIVPVTIKGRKGNVVVDADEYIRDGVTIDALNGLKPAFDKQGTITAANASGINDGAAAVVLMSAEEATARGAKVMGHIRSWATSGVEPSRFGIGPVPAVRKALDKAGWTVADLDLIEANEAFAAQALAVGRELGFDEQIVNVNGGAIAIGHPIGASGARVLTTLLHEMEKRDARKGLVTLCIGGGMGIAMCIERSS
ncbi:acetyl-CoA C-acetyltransferase [Novosphingobium mathurense]|uniref:Acetyl-CoA acetyltransferase n=1 Tax=Novosphingobium mathurense TaxID=428990 RepID=A0A1U6IHV8_9SPHN|nr:acetyl-CoA C-acetyltransferase [Novosphingobium mathurense]SLK07597.1 acetyl-CoA acetyltransferase [Novosphingobium mathurense]